MKNPYDSKKRKNRMLIYPYMILTDGTEITHSAMSDDGHVSVFIKNSDRSAICLLPEHIWEWSGFSVKEKNI